MIVDGLLKLSPIDMRCDSKYMVHIRLYTVWANDIDLVHWDVYGGFAQKTRRKTVLVVVHVAHCLVFLVAF